MGFLVAKRRNKQTMAYDQLSDEEVFALVQSANDQLAFKTLYGRYNKRIYAYCLRVLGNREDANDVFQIIAMAIYDKRDSFKDGSFVAWLFTITRNTCLKAVRNRRTTTELNEEIHTKPDISSFSDDFILKDSLHRAVQSLQDEFREALELRYFDDLSYEQIAACLGITESLAKIRVFRAKKQIASILAPIMDELK